jgi:copper homeostasis protein
MQLFPVQSTCSYGLIHVGCGERGLRDRFATRRELRATVLTKKIILEISVESLAGAQAAERGGAARLELCSELSAGGVTPAPGLMPAVRAAVRLPIFAMIRPRSGGFVYSDAEFATMKSAINEAKQAGMDGVVLGMLTLEHTIDIARTAELVELAAPLLVTFHRAFDVASDLRRALDEVLKTGAQRILSSGGAFDAFKGAAMLASLRTAARGKIQIVPGTGINAGNIAEIAQITRAREIHSGLGSVMAYGSVAYDKFESEVRKMTAALGAAG